VFEAFPGVLFVLRTWARKSIAWERSVKGKVKVYHRTGHEDPEGE